MKASRQTEVNQALAEYFRSYFDEQAAVLGFTPIALWNTTISSALQGNTVYPCADVLVKSRTIIGPHFTAYNCQLSVFFADNLGENGEAVINGWADVIEAAFRHDHTLGGVCVNCSENITVEAPRFDNGIWFAGVSDFTIEVADGPYVYGEDA